ncbi:methyltransferase family protein [Hydrogenimonas urashimensis]|uniref:methyltransferase family protein n=1 Tax=Hydrogenimonas urashimensis TaxID=2740515 RepID=UPI001915DBF8|nr:isoprenylcysteine carboxylmethyltransferase family protein [Hydrogenimonas urashimensis]
MRINTSFSVVVRLLLWALLLIGGTCLGIWLDLRHFRELFFSWIWHLLSFPAGIGLMALAFKAAAAGGRELAKSGKSSPDVPRLETDRLVTTGIYAHMRHPMLFGLTLVPLALAFVVGSPAFITIVAPVEMVFIVVMVLTLEERECRRKFGDDYERYAREVPPVCFTPHCLRLLFFQKNSRK